MANPTPMLFDNTRDRRPRRVLMHVCDAGDGCGMECEPTGAHSVRFECPRCGHRTGWTRVESVAAGKRGVPCPRCNGADGAAGEGGA